MVSETINLTMMYQQLCHWKATGASGDSVLERGAISLADMQVPHRQGTPTSQSRTISSSSIFPTLHVAVI